MIPKLVLTLILVEVQALKQKHNSNKINMHIILKFTKNIAGENVNRIKTKGLNQVDHTFPYMPPPNIELEYGAFI